VWKLIDLQIQMHKLTGKPVKASIKGLVSSSC
jgi:hypothetical protein